MPVDPMAHTTEVTTESLIQLKRRCAQESARFFNRQRNDPRYCFELFRRAIVDRDERAWASLYQQYAPLVSAWVKRHSAYNGLDEETQFFINGAFTKMWSVLTPEKFQGFPDLKSLLRYLQMCVNSVIVDFLRGREEALLLEDLKLDPGDVQPGEIASVEKQVFQRARDNNLWQALDGRLKDEKERCVIYGSYVLALKPSQVYEHYPQLFADVKEIYRVKENVLARLRRDDELRNGFGEF